MATGVKPRDDEPQLTRNDIDLLETAFKNQKFRDMLADYCEEIRDPENQALYQREMKQLEKERGVDVTFVNPQPGYVIKTSVAGDRKAFVNICSSDTAGKPSCSIKVVDGKKGLDWQIPYTLIPPREDYDHKKQRCILYDVVFHPDTLRMTTNNKCFRELVNKTALDALQSAYNINLDRNNVRFPRSSYKGWAMPAVIRQPIPGFDPDDLDTSDLAPEIAEKLYPQRCYPEPTQTMSKERFEIKPTCTERNAMNQYTTPKYVIRQQKNVELQDFTYDRNNKRHTAIPSQIVIEINLPLVCSTGDCTLDVRGKELDLVCEKPAKYKLHLTLPYSVDDKRGQAKFDITKRTLYVTLPVSNDNFVHDLIENIQGLKLDSGVESEGNSASDEDITHVDLITELDTSLISTAEPADAVPCYDENIDNFLNPNFSYSLPSHTSNILDDTIAFTFHVKNCDPESVATTQPQSNIVRIKFTSIGAGYVPVHYTAFLKFHEEIYFDGVNAEAWDNNVILHLESTATKPDYVLIGLDEENLSHKILKVILTPGSEPKHKNGDVFDSAEVPKPIVEVTNMARETTVTVTSNDSGSESSTESSSALTDRVPIWTTTDNCENGAKSILRKPLHISRSLSESSAGDIASSIDYISSDCIPEESSLKKTVRFNEVIARHRYRYNSSIEGQKKKNQRKKSKKRNLERRKSESEAEDEIFKKVSEKKCETKEKIRHDSGLADTSDGDNEENKLENHEHLPEKIKPQTCATIKHKTDFYNPENLNKGQYLEVNFKNDLIFDLDI